MMTKEILNTALKLGKKYAVPALMGIVAAKNCISEMDKEAELKEMKNAISELQKKVMGS